MPLTPGISLGPYQIEAPLGAGSMGEVYKATDTRLDRSVAIKVLPERVALDPDLKQRFEREARTVAALNHPHICTLHDIGSHEPSTGSGPAVDYIVMEYLEGQTLAQRLESGALPLDQALQITMDIADALDKAHRQGIVHRDVKPSNVMWTESGAKLLDFGIAGRFSSSEVQTATRSTIEVGPGDAIAGTLPYMAPEVLSGEPPMNHSDIWSLGILLYELVNGSRPFVGKTAAHVTSSILRDPPPPLRSSGSDAVSRIVHRCLAKDPRRRYRHAGELRAALETARQTSNDEGVSASSTIRRPVPTGVVPGIVTLLVMGLAVASYMAVWGPRYSEAPAVSARDTIRSVAVLPFENLSGDPDQEYFATGMTDLLTTNLSSLGSLRLVARPSVAGPERAADSLERMGAELGVDAFVLGSVFRADRNVRITAQLVDSQSSEQLWGDSYTGHASEIFALQGDTARAIAREIGVVVTPEEAQRFANAKSIDPQAWDAYFRGRHHLEEYAQDPVQVAVDAFERALTREPEFALAHADLARAYLQMIQQGWVSAAEYLPRVRASAEDAIRLDPTLADAHVSLALLDYRSSRNWDGLDQRFERAIRANPNSSNAWHHYSHYLMSTLRVDEAIDAALRAREVDPLSRGIRLHAAVTYVNARRWDDAIETALETLERYPDYSRIRHPLAQSYLQAGDVAAAMAQYEALVTLSREADNLAGLAVAHAVGGEPAQARAVLDDLTSRGGPPYHVAGIQAALGDIDAAFEWLGRAIEVNQGFLADLLVAPSFDALRSDPRWPELLSRAGFSDRLVDLATSKS